MCRKMRSETAERVVQARLHRPDGAIHHLCDLREVQAVQVVEHDHEAVLRSELLDRAQHEPSELRLLGLVGGRAVLVRERLVDRVVERREDDALTRSPVVREVDRNPIQPRTQRGVRFEAGERTMGARESVDHDLFGGRGILRDREPEAEDPIAVFVEKGVKGLRLAVSRA